MSIIETTEEALRRAQDLEGLVLQGCGGPVQEWQDGINGLLTSNGIFKDGSWFEDVYVFRHEGRTCLLFPFSDNMDINMGRLALWRIQSREQFEGMWLSDFVDIKLGGPLQDQQGSGMPDCPLIGDDGNVFYMMAKASRTLKERGMEEQAGEMRQRITQCQSYDDALCILGEYVNITSVAQEEEMSMDMV